MELVLVVLTESTPEAGTGTSSQTLADILWANATPADGLQHVNVRPGPQAGSRVIGLFLLPGRTDTDGDAARRALCVCQRAIHGAPALNGWTVALLQPRQVRPRVSGHSFS